MIVVGMIWMKGFLGGSMDNNDKYVEEFLKKLEKKGFTVTNVTEDEILIKKNDFSTTMKRAFLRSFFGV
jgi:hypothetical protein